MFWHSPVASVPAAAGIPAVVGVPFVPDVCAVACNLSIVAVPDVAGVGVSNIGFTKNCQLPSSDYK